MSLDCRPYRSVLYTPASSLKLLEKTHELAADAFIFDLEDAIAPLEKASARSALITYFGQKHFSDAPKIVRINAITGPWGADDCRAVQELTARKAPIDGILIPKTDDYNNVEKIARILPDIPLWAMIETPQGVLNAPAIAGHPRIAALVMGCNDLGRELGLASSPNRLGLHTSLGLCVLAARAHKRLVLDGVHNRFHDATGLYRECEQAREFGFDGKTLIHPKQIEIANQAFAPPESDVARAQRVIAAFDAALAQGQGVAVLDGEIVERLHVDAARHLLEKARIIHEQTER